MFLLAEIILFNLSVSLKACMVNASNCTCWNAAAKEVPNVKKCNIGKVEGRGGGWRGLSYDKALIRCIQPRRRRRK